MHLKKGQCVFYEGDIADNFYIVMKGKVSVMTLKDAATLEKERKEMPLQRQLEI